MAKRHELELAQASLVLCERNIKQGESFVRAQRKLAAEIKENVARLQEGIAEAKQTKSRDNRRRAELEGERAEAVDRIARLSRREREVLDGLVAGKPNKSIAFDLSISPRTVEIYRSNIMHKVQVVSLPNLVRVAMLAAESPR
jgi:FixJ family two-component response regulator